jgi:chromate transporter
MSSAPPVPELPAPSDLRQIIRVFLKIGLFAYGGPAAHIAMFHDEIVVRRRWLTQAEFLDLLGVVNLVPGPNSVELSIHIGMQRAGWRGMAAAGLCFILPAMGIVLLLAWLYQQYGSTPAASALLYGMLPVVIAIIFQAMLKLSRAVYQTPILIAAGGASLLLYFLNTNPLLALLGCGAAVMLWQNKSRLRSLSALLPVLPFALLPAAAPPASAAAFSLWMMFWIFFKIGSVLYGSGYVLLAFLKSDFVTRLGWLTEQQLLDAVAIGQVTPGPLFTTATFIGYLLGGFTGGLVATAGIFLPSFIIVAFSSQIIPHIRRSVWAGALLDGINAASIGLMAAVTIDLAREAFVDLPAVLIGILAAVLGLRFKVASTWLIAGGALLGVVLSLLG